MIIIYIKLYICICQKVSVSMKMLPTLEIIHYGNNNIQGYTVYEISLEMKYSNGNIYKFMEIETPGDTCHTN